MCMYDFSCSSKNWAVNWPSNCLESWGKGSHFHEKHPEPWVWARLANQKPALTPGDQWEGCTWHANLCPNSHWVVPALCDIYNVWYKDIKHNLHPTRLGWERVNIDFNRFIKISQRSGGYLVWEELPWCQLRLACWWHHKNFSDWLKNTSKIWLNEHFYVEESS